MYKSCIHFFSKNVSKYKHFYNNKFSSQLYKYSTTADIDKSLINNYIKNLQQEYQKYVEQKKDSVGDMRLNYLKPIIEVSKQRNKILELLQGIEELLNEKDIEMKKMAKEEYLLYEKKLLQIEEDLLELLIPINHEDSYNSIILEINAGVGGQEAMLFAKELYEMYCNFIEYKGWSSEVVELDVSDIGGLRHASIIVNGPEVFKFFKYEAGVHRVQRIPATEKSGRIHTSTVSIVALPQPNDIDIVIHDKDLRIDTMRASGAGGQHVNTTDSAVRIVHLPTNTMVECQVNRSQIKNKEIAMKKLKALLYEKQLNEQIVEAKTARKTQVKSNNRNEKIRTYNFSQDRITDHRLQGCNMHNLKVFLEGREILENLIDKLHQSFREKQLLDILSCNKNT